MSVTVRKWQEPEDMLQLGIIRRRLEAEGMASAWYSEAPGAAFPEHRHSFSESRCNSLPASSSSMGMASVTRSRLAWARAARGALWLK